MSDHQANLVDYLRGLVRVNPEMGEDFAHYAGWKELACQVAAHGREDFLRHLPRDLLLAIAAGEADPAAAAWTALQRIDLDQ